MLLGSLKRKLKKFINPKSNTPKDFTFKGSEKYWEDRYVNNNNSGAGSYGRLAVFKAAILNKFVLDNKIDTVLEFGSGDGNQLLIAEYPNYIGYDVSKQAILICEKLFKNDDSKRFLHYDTNTFNAEITKAELVISLDVIYHLVEDEVFYDYMNRLFLTATKYVVIYSSNYNDHFADHVKCRQFTDWIEANLENKWKLKTFIKNDYPFDAEDPNNTSMADFYIYEISK